jgi:hypothetical protein
MYKLIIIFCLLANTAFAQDTLKPIIYLVDINLSQLKTNKLIAGGINADNIRGFSNCKWIKYYN